MRKSLGKALKRSAVMALAAYFMSLGMTAEAVNKLGFSEEELAYMPATKQIELFKKGDLAPIDVLEAQIARVNKYNGPQNTKREELKDYLTFNGKVNAICFDKFDEARAEAIEAEKRYKNGTARPLEGITLAVKNENQVVGWVVDEGSLLEKDNPPCTENSAIIEKLNAAGAIKVFSTTVPEFYVTYMTWTKLYGVTRNPWNLNYGVGGSSGGSGASLAAGFCTLATGSDMGGSIRIPASMNGIYGFKAPFGRIPTSNTQFETQGPLARNFKDLVLMTNVINGPSPKIMSSLRPRLEYPTKYAPLKGTKIAVSFLKEWAGYEADKDTIAAMNNTIAKLRQAGAQVDVIDDLDWKAKEFLPVYVNGLFSTEFAYMVEMASADQETINKLCRYTQQLTTGQVKPSSKGTIEIDNLRNKMHSRVQEKVFGKGYLALICPTLVTSHVPPDVDSSADRLPMVNGKPGLSQPNMYTPIWNVLDRYPVVDVPAGFTDKNVPIGVQVIGNTFSDLDAFRVAAALSKMNQQNGEELYVNGKLPDFRKE